MKPSYDIIPMLSIHPTCINTYSQVVWHPYKPGKIKPIIDPDTGEIFSPGNDQEIKSPAAHLLTSDKKHHGIVSPQARRKISKAIDYLLYLSNDKILPDTSHGRAYKFKLAFVTLTLPSKQVHPDNLIKDQILNQLFVELRKHYAVHRYIWRAEKQKNGNIHFHILVDKFIPWSELRDRWNRICEKLGYVSRYRDEMRRFHAGGFRVREDLLKQWEYKKQVQAYKAGKANDWSNPNSSDIHSLRHVTNVKEYVIKYCTKNEDNSEVTGRMWGCSYDLSDITGATCVMCTEIKDQLNALIQELHPRIYSSDYFSVIHLPVGFLASKKFESLFSLFQGYLHSQFKVETNSKLLFN
jgi:hypothetical protein